MSDDAKACQICGEPMPPGEEMFVYHGYSGPCPKPPIPRVSNAELAADLIRIDNSECPDRGIGPTLRLAAERLTERTIK
jgi:hypothetical protein